MKDQEAHSNCPQPIWYSPLNIKDNIIYKKELTVQCFGVNKIPIKIL